MQISFYLVCKLMVKKFFKKSQILTKTKRDYFYILIVATQIKQILLKRYDFFSYIFNVNENLIKADSAFKITAVQWSLIILAAFQTTEKLRSAITMTANS